MTGKHHTKCFCSNKNYLNPINDDRGQQIKGDSQNARDNKRGRKITTTPVRQFGNRNLNIKRQWQFEFIYRNLKKKFETYLHDDDDVRPSKFEDNHEFVWTFAFRLTEVFRIKSAGRETVIISAALGTFDLKLGQGQVKR